MRRGTILLWLALCLGGLAAAHAQQPDADNRNPNEECLAENNDATRPSAGGPAYPFDIERIRFALGRLGASRQSVSVLVVDNGFAGFLNDAQGRRASTNFPKDFFFADATRDPIDPASDDAALLWGHGTHVTGIIMGGMYGATNPIAGDPGTPEVRKLFFDNFVSTAAPGGLRDIREWLSIYVVPLREGNQLWDTKRLLLLSNKSQIPFGFRPVIINMSLAHTALRSDDMVAFRGLPTSLSDSLVVASAGNAGQRLDPNAGPYPAMSNFAAGNLIVVGAHNSDLGHSTFSNYHPERVTLAAPGCAIKSWLTGTGGAKAANGTSQAAAVVSFGAALLESRWQTDPNDIRERLIASSRYSRSLAGGCGDIDQKEPCVLWGNALDIEMALYYDVDAIEYCVKPGQAPPDCPTRIALGELTAVPAAITKKAGPDIEGAVSDTVPKMTYPSAIRTMDDGSHQFLYRFQAAGSGQTFKNSDTAPIIDGSSFSFRLLGAGSQQPPQPEGALPLTPGETLTLGVDRVARVVLRSLAGDRRP